MFYIQSLGNEISYWIGFAYYSVWLVLVVMVVLKTLHDKRELVVAIRHYRKWILALLLVGLLFLMVEYFFGIWLISKPRYAMHAFVCDVNPSSCLRQGFY